MDETTLRLLLSYAVRALLAERPETERMSDPDLFAKRVADACLDGLVVALRDCLARKEEFLLDEVGVFRPGDQWTFEPAASLIEAEATQLPPEDGNLLLARKTLFYLRQGVELLNDCAGDVVIPGTPGSEKMTAAELVVSDLFGETRAPRNLSEFLPSLAWRVQRNHRRLTAESVSEVPLTAEALGLKGKASSWGLKAGELQD